MGFNDLGDHHYRRGDYANALKCYQRTRDYCTTSKHNIQMVLNVIRVAIETEQFPTVSLFATKALATPDVAKDVCPGRTWARLRPASGCLPS